MGAKVNNPRKSFLFSVQFLPKSAVNPYLFQKVQLPEIGLEVVSHGDVNRDVKTAGRVSIGNLVLSKLETTSGSDTWIFDWLASCQDHILQGGALPRQYWRSCQVSELAEDGVSILDTWVLTEVWPSKINGRTLDRMSSDNTIDEIELTVGTCEKLRLV